MFQGEYLIIANIDVVEVAMNITNTFYCHYFH